MLDGWKVIEDFKLLMRAVAHNYSQNSGYTAPIDRQKKKATSKGQFCPQRPNAAETGVGHVILSDNFLIEKFFSIST